MIFDSFLSLLLRLWYRDRMRETQERKVEWETPRTSTKERTWAICKLTDTTFSACKDDEWCKMVRWWKSFVSGFSIQKNIEEKRKIERRQKWKQTNSGDKNLEFQLYFVIGQHKTYIYSIAPHRRSIWLCNHTQMAHCKFDSFLFVLYTQRLIHEFYL